MTKPLVSILIPAFNREKLIKRSIDSALNQSYRNIEIISVDNRSTDGTYEVLKRYAESYDNIHIYQNTLNIGPVLNLKKCIEYSSGHFIKVLFSDDWIEKYFVERGIKYLEARNDIGFVFSNTLIHLCKETKEFYKLSNKDKILPCNDFIYYSLFGGYLPVSPSNALFRREDITKNYLVDIPNNININFRKFGAGNDLLIYLITATKYRHFAYMSEPLTHFGGQNDSITISNDLEIYYMAAKLFFVDNYIHDKNIKNSFKSMTWLLSMKKRRKFAGLIGIKDIKISETINFLLNRYI